MLALVAEFFAFLHEFYLLMKKTKIIRVSNSDRTAYTRPFPH